MESVWQFHCEDLSQRLDYLLTSGKLSDCKFLVGTKPNQEVIEAHKTILASATPVFEAMFYGKMAEQQSPILAPDIQPDAFRTMLTYIYGKKDITINSFDEARNLYCAANKSFLPHLKEKCIAFIRSQLTSSLEFAVPTYEFALLYEEKELLNESFSLLCRHTYQVVKYSSFLDAKLSTVVTIYSLENEIRRDELDLFNGLEAYAKAYKERMERSVDNNTYSGLKDIVPVSVRSSAKNGSESESQEQDRQSTESKEESIFRSLIKKIRFLCLTAQQFAEGPAKSDLLTDSEKYAILMNIVSEKSHVPMPSGFSTIKPTLGFDSITLECYRYDPYRI